MLVWAFFELLASPFAVPARALNRAIGGIARRVAALLAALDFGRDLGISLARPTHAAWHVVAPLVMLMLTALLAYGDGVLYFLRFAALLDPNNQRGVRAPADLEIGAVLAWIGAIGVWGAVAWDLSGAAPGYLPYGNLGPRPRRLLGWLTAFSLGLCLVAAALFFGWGQLLIETGKRHSELTVTFSVLYALITIGGLLVAAWSLPVGLVAVTTLLMAALGCLLGLLFLPFALVVTVINRLAALCGAALILPTAMAYSLLNLVRMRLALTPLSTPPTLRPVAPDISQHLLPPALQTAAEFDIPEEETMPDSTRNIVFAGRGSLATFCLPLAEPNYLIQAKALYSPERQVDPLGRGGVLDLSLSKELVNRIYASTGRPRDALDLLRMHWLAQLLPQLSGIRQFFWLEALPLQDPGFTNTLLRELKTLRPGLAISVLSATPDPDQRSAQSGQVDQTFSRLRADGVIDAVVYVDPVSPFARRYGAKLQLQALMNTIAGVLTASQLDPSAPSPVEAMRRLGAAGDATLAFASRPVGAGRRKLLAAALHLKKGHGDVGELVIQASAAALEASSSQDALTFSDAAVAAAPAAFYVAQLPIGPRDPRAAEAEEQLRPLIGEGAPGAVVLVSCRPGLRLPGNIGDYVTSVGVLFNLASPVRPVGSANGHQPRLNRRELAAVRGQRGEEASDA